MSFIISCILFHFVYHFLLASHLKYDILTFCITAIIQYHSFEWISIWITKKNVNWVDEIIQNSRCRIYLIDQRNKKWQYSQLKGIQMFDIKKNKSGVLCARSTAVSMQGNVVEISFELWFDHWRWKCRSILPIQFTFIYNFEYNSIRCLRYSSFTMQRTLWLCVIFARLNEEKKNQLSHIFSLLSFSSSHFFSCAIDCWRNFNFLRAQFRIIRYDGIL